MKMDMAGPSLPARRGRGRGRRGGTHKKGPGPGAFCCWGGWGGGGRGGGGGGGGRVLIEELLEAREVEPTFLVALMPLAGRVARVANPGRRGGQLGADAHEIARGRAHDRAGGLDGNVQAAWGSAESGAERDQL